MELNRRRFLQVGALGVAAAIVQTCREQRDRGLDQPSLIATLGTDRVRELGAHYRAQTPNESTVETLRAAIDSNRGSRLLRRSIDDVVQDDFAEGRTVLVDGWVLSITEARQAALFSLSHPA
jgi:hypothetical protein